MIHLFLLSQTLLVSFIVRAENFTVSKRDTLADSCKNCLKVKSFLEALHQAFQSQENCFIMLEDKDYEIDSEAIKIFLEGGLSRSTKFLENSAMSDEGRNIYVKGNIESSFSELIFYEDPISIYCKALRLNFENIHFIFKRQFSSTREEFSCFFCFKVFELSMKSLSIFNSSITIIKSDEDTFFDSPNNFSLIEISGSNSMLWMENISIVITSFRIFKNLFRALSLDGDSNGERGVFMRNISFSGDVNSPIMIGYFSDITVKMNLVTIENIRIYEIFGLKSKITIEKSNFYLKYYPLIPMNQEIFLLLEKSYILLKDSVLMGNKTQFNATHLNNVVLNCLIECNVIMTEVLLQDILTDQVNIKKKKKI